MYWHSMIISAARTEFIEDLSTFVSRICVLSTSLFSVFYVFVKA